MTATEALSRIVTLAKEITQNRNVVVHAPAAAAAAESIIAVVEKSRVSRKVMAGDIDEVFALDGPTFERIFRTLNDVKNEFIRAKQKHGDQTPDGPCLSEGLKQRFEMLNTDPKSGDANVFAALRDSANLRRLATLVEETGEVGRALTYDKDHSGGLRKELIQVAAMAVAWASILGEES